MNEDDRRRIFKAKKRRQKKRRREKKREEARQARSADRQRRIQQEAERIIQARVDQGDLVVPIERDSTRPASTRTEAVNLKKAPIEIPRMAPTVKGQVHGSKRKVHPRKLHGVKAIVTL